MNIVRNYTLLIVLMLAPLAASHGASLYKWTDEEGNVHYTQSPPTERPAEVITTESAPPAQSEKEEQEESQAPEGASSVDATNMRIKKQNCEAARKNLEIYQTAEIILQEDGSELLLSDEMRAAKLKETQQQINLYCN